MISERKNKYFSYILCLISIGYFIYGFLINENSAGAGGANGDILHTWNNLQIFLNNDFHFSINNYYSNRSPLIYVLHNFLNPFIDNQFNFRLSVFYISCLIPLLFFICLKIKFEKINNSILLLISSIILFSPYVRTSGYWALEENFGVISILLTYLFFNLFVNNNKFKFLNLFLLIFFSSLCVYFDLKLIIFPLIIFFSILFLNVDKIFKILMAALYFLASIPYLLLIYAWGNIFSPVAANSHTFSQGLYYDHIIYILPILSLYILPFYILQNKFDWKNIMQNLNFNIIFVISIILGYLVFFYNPIELSYHAHVGNGFIFKIGQLIENILLQKIFFFIVSLLSYIFLMIYFKRKIYDWLIILYFILLSVITYPLLQEYFDPVIYILTLLFFRTKINFNYNSSYIFYLLFLSMSLFAKFYYEATLNV